MIPDSHTISHEEAEQLLAKLPDPITFDDEAAIRAMTEDQAREVMRAVRRMLLSQLLYQEYHEHMLDDCGDYLAAAAENWHNLWSQYFYNDGTGFRERVIEFLLEPPNEWGGCDGEVRNDILPKIAEADDKGFEEEWRKGK